MGDSLILDDPPCRVAIRENGRARRLTLRMTVDGEAAVTVPPGVPVSEVRDFLRRHREWLRKALARVPGPILMANGVALPVGGKEVRLTLVEGPRRPPVLEGDRVVLQGAGAPGPRVSAWLKILARDRLEPSARTYARQLGRKIARITLRDTTSRWGSCSSSGSLNFSWRLAMAPVEVQDYVAAHEAAHLVEMNHSARYWKTLEGIMPDYEDRRGWLRQHGRGLHAYRFTTD